MSQGFGRTKRRIAESKRQKREEKRLKRLKKRDGPPVEIFPSVAAEAVSAELPPAEPDTI